MNKYSTINHRDAVELRRASKYKKKKCASISTSYREIVPIFSDDPPKASPRFAISASVTRPGRTRGILNNGRKYRREDSRVEIEGRISVGTDPLRNFPCQKHRQLARLSRACFSSNQFSALVVSESWKRST